MKQKVEPGKINENTYLIDINMLGMAKITSMFVVKGRKTALIDGGTSSEAQGIIKSLRDFGLLPVDYIIISHSHWDHHQAVPALLKEMSGKEVELLAHPKAIPLLEDPSKVGYDFGTYDTLLPIKGVKPIKEGDAVDLGGVELQVIDTPGHTPDSISLLDSKNRSIFVSDAVADKTDDTTCLPAIMPPSFDPDTYVSTLEKLKSFDYESMCLGHYGMFYGPDVKHVLDEARTMYEQVWRFFDDNVDKLVDLEWITNSMIEKFMPNSKTVKRIGTMFAMAVVNWAIDGYKMCKRL
ncbi:MAG: MBL fold metallo-hydrolase [Candidatus Bathyarchaeota archaeon]|nr:MBL fold metallo-hydrolase [Candidatus Bathyarchaeota archaeon]